MTELLPLVRQIRVLRSELKLLSEREQELKKQIIELIKTQGTADDKGSLSCDLDDEVSGVNKAVWQRRISKTFDPATAEDLLESKGLLERCTTSVPVLDEEEIMRAYYEDDLTEEDIDTMFPAKETWALILSDK